MNAQSIERQRIGRRGKIEKGRGEQEKVSGTEKKKGTDSEEWRQLTISAKRSVITERGRQTASFLFYSEIKTLINLNQQGSWTSPFLRQTPGGGGVSLPASCPFITQRKKTPPPGASWVILRGRKRGDGERMAAGPFVIYCSLSPSAPRHTHNL